MKLACVRCNRKKIKCDRGEPTCHQCITAKSECQYVERRKRPRLAPERASVLHLSQRVESLEKQMVIGQDHAHFPQAQAAAEHNMPSPNSAPPETSPSEIESREKSPESWIFRMASATRNGFLAANSQSPQSTEPTIMAALNEALADLGSLKAPRYGMNGQSSKTALQLSSAESRECIDVFLNYLSALFMCNMIGIDGFPEKSSLYSFPEIVNSPYVTLDPSLHVLYYNAVFYGLHLLHGPRDARTQAAFGMILESVPLWLAAQSEKDLDCWTSQLTTWTVIINLDYQLSWKFHCKSCHMIRKRGIDRIDVTFAATQEEELERVKLRPLYWHALWCDMFFSLFYGKPRFVRYAAGRVKSPLHFFTARPRPKPSQIMLASLFMQSTIMTAEILELVDGATEEERQGGLQEKVDEFCSETEELFSDCNLENLLKSPHTTNEVRYVAADYIMSICTIIIGVKRYTRCSAQEHPVDRFTLRAARTVVGLVLDYVAPPRDGDVDRFISMLFLSFYPFCAIFSLYEHIISCTNPDDCEDDLRALEMLGSVMTQTSHLRADFATLANTVNALNKVSRTLHDGRRRDSSASKPATTTQTHNPLAPDMGQQQPTSPGSETTAAMATFPPLKSPELQFSEPNSFTFPEFTDDGYLEALEFVRSLENDFMEGNLQGGWWNTGDTNPTF